MLQEEWKSQVGVADGQRSKTQESLPFTVRIVKGEEALQKAVAIRHAAYARHIDADLAEALKAPDEVDALTGTAIFLAESKLDGSPLGTMRVQTNEHRPLALERSIDLPDWLRSEKLAEATRLGVAQACGVTVRMALFKAYYLYCRRQDIRYMVITARRPLDRMYDRLLFSDVFPGLGYVPLAHVFNLPHRIMHFDVAASEALWVAANHPLLSYMCDTEHKDFVI